MKIVLKAFFRELYKKSIDEDIFSSAAQVAFYFSFAIFPLLLFLVTLLGFVLGSANDFRSDLFFYLASIMPISAFELVRTTMEEVTASSSGGKLTIGLLVALWSASAGVDSLRTALNGVYGYKEKRSWFLTKAISVTFTFVLAILVIFALGGVFYGWQGISHLFGLVGFDITSPYILVALQWLITFALLLVVFEILYNILPSRKPFRWYWITPGAFVGIILWLLLSNGLRTYLYYWNTYDRFYGSLGAVIILMLWLYLTSLVILIGGMINSIIDGIKDGSLIGTKEP
ncbi:MAG: YihY/virulence factor BrkB family protein [Acidobacteriota bacterium]|nr:MAG: YihY/virulence factor BrkB family protein [Acidobacteriota bacterium]